MPRDFGLVDDPEKDDDPQQESESRDADPTGRDQDDRDNRDDRFDELRNGCIGSH